MEQAVTDTLTIVENIQGWQVLSALFLRRLAEHALPFSEQAAWATDGREFVDMDGAPLLRLHRDGQGQKALLGWDNGPLAYALLDDGQAFAVAAAQTPEACSAVLRAIRASLPNAPVGNDAHRIPLWLWTMTPNGPRKIRRMIDVPAWSDIEGNYAQGTRDGLARLMQGRPESGRFLLWSGKPGTGKTYALRSLGSEWRSFCDLHYVVDPEILFGEQPSYLVSLLLDGEETALEGGPNTVNEEPRWRLIILEDTGEMLTMDAKREVGQALSRLLNVTDGLIGQGMRILILVTTNEEVGALHPAMIRSGRCAAQVAFAPLSPTEAEEWLQAHGVPQASGAAALADLFALASGATPRPGERRAGFTLVRSGT